MNHTHIHQEFKNWAKYLNRHFSQKDIQVANKHMKRFSASSIIRKMAIKSARLSWTPVAHASNPNYLGGRDWEDCGLRSDQEKVQEAPISTNKLGVVVHACHPSKKHK
jgi:hypothetical protein